MTRSSGYLRTGLRIRVLAEGDAEGLADAYFFTPEQQLEIIRAKLAQHAAGSEVPWILVKERDDGGGRARTGSGGERVVGAVTLTGIVRGPFLSANLGYWVDSELTGQGIGTAAVLFAATHARTELGLHRIQAATLPSNTASRRILQRTGFQEIGVAPEYLQIAGQWQDHLLHQLILPPP